MIHSYTCIIHTQAYKQQPPVWLTNTMPRVHTLLPTYIRNIIHGRIHHVWKAPWTRIYTQTICVTNKFKVEGPCMHVFACIQACTQCMHAHTTTLTHRCVYVQIYIYMHSIRVTDKSKVEGLPESALSLAADTGMRIFMHAYSHVCMYICVCLSIYIYIYTHAQRKHVYAHSVSACVKLHVCASVHTWIHACAHVCVCVCDCVKGTRHEKIDAHLPYIRINMRTTHIHTHAYTAHSQRAVRATRRQLPRRAHGYLLWTCLLTFLCSSMPRTGSSESRSTGAFHDPREHSLSIHERLGMRRLRN